MPMQAPRFWQKPGIASTLLSPLSNVYSLFSGRRRDGVKAEQMAVPVICVGNVVAGGAGKTPTVRYLIESLNRFGKNPHIISRGYKAALHNVRVNPANHTAALVGDEPLMLSRDAPCWIGSDRVENIRSAVAEGADCILMDDGLQNPSVKKDFSLLVIDGGYGIGNGQCMPAGPLREPFEAALERCQAVVMIGEDTQGLMQRMGEIPVFTAHLKPHQPSMLRGWRWLAFAGIGRPEKFFQTLAECKANIVQKESFSDHHIYSEVELQKLYKQAQDKGARLITTEKDGVRLPEHWKQHITSLPVSLVVDNQQELQNLILPLFTKDVA